jgi:pimeloyl-ACP methyl ester carboxylesterase
MSSWWWILICLFLLAFGLLQGCQQKPPSVTELQKGLVWMFPGIEGGYWSLAEVRRALRDGGVDKALMTHKWQWPFMPLMNLMDHKGNQREAAKVAKEIAAYQQSFPDRPIDLVGYSGGGGIVIMVLEALPQDVHVRNVALVHAAISTDYDLTNALQHVNGTLHNYYSEYDVFILGAGTSIFGNIDRKKDPAAGCKGFNLEKAVPNHNDINKVEQHAWKIDDLKKGQWGGHAAIAFYNWNKQYIAPLLK